MRGVKGYRIPKRPVNAYSPSLARKPGIFEMPGFLLVTLFSHGSSVPPTAQQRGTGRRPIALRSRGPKADHDPRR